ncbi:LysR family transcriptional regulator [Trinickia caryophylli]|uniref:DNA-binding transcriptional regulator, LysR family n=1 Tax=Trinickia caryophylli TaxID=28094 RepID=A0A1X7ECE0_TRICW|nr:LysR family transcriptional regulator [Trinickia caryophylli]PMS12913.1 LysR family transcriptional regulator [Trinickia caryophylli]TRX14670.1 LysR family transcriptional regulator [Trinickia caryophylli]WQE14514.1 LysR family transcriptional regulator [Trinickia caryophylli]SMF31490.1 DNA-binding transcriptional regulator, LysR family [Trinickia caryophylli]GLU32080.1 LysR family transcriptional regulator [Trinickia caryophylli]
MNTDPLNSRAVTYLYEVAVQGGVRAAAEALAVNPSVVSRQIALLERTLRMPLLTRQGRTVVVTEVGQMLVDFHRDRQRGTRQLHAQLAEYRGLERGRITVAVGEGFVEGFVTGALQRFSLKHPHISIDIRSGSTSAVVAMVRNDEVDIGLCVGAGREPGCKTRTFSLGPLCAVMTPDHALAGTSKVQPSALAGHRLIFMASHFAVQEHLQAMLDAEALTLAPAYRCDLFSTAQTLAAAGLGIAFMSAAAARRRIEEKQLVAVPLDHPIARNFRSQLMTRSGRRLPPAADHLWKQLAVAMTQV